MTVLNHFVSEVLADVDVLGTFSSTNNMVSPFDACYVVFIDQKRYCLLQFRSPKHDSFVVSCEQSSRRPPRHTVSPIGICETIKMYVLTTPIS